MVPLSPMCDELFSLVAQMIFSLPLTFGMLIIMVKGCARTPQTHKTSILRNELRDAFKAVASSPPSLPFTFCQDF